MNFEKIRKSYNMRFGKAPYGVCFCGMALPLLKGADAGLYAPLSVGGYLALSTREDGRFTAEFDGNQKNISVNVMDTEYHKEEPMTAFLEKLKKRGVTLGGADILFGYNTKIYGGFEPLLLTATYFFCPKVLPPETLKNCLTNPSEHYASFIGVRDTLLFTQGGRDIYVKFSDKIAKIVLCCIKERNRLSDAAGNEIKNAVLHLSAGDYERFGKKITEESRKILLSGGVGRHTRALFELAVRLNDGLGYGILSDGGIFAVVENKKVNAFIQNIQTEYEAYFGAPPDFYITRAENSGINAAKKDL